MAEGKRLHESSLGQVLTGLFVAVAASAFVWQVVALRRGPDSYPLIAEFDTLPGVSEATIVELRGYVVGRVEEIDFRPVPPPGEPYFLVRLAIEEGYPLLAGTVAQIRGGGLVGESRIDLDVTEATGSVLAPGTHLPGRADESMKSLMEKVKEAAERLGGAGRSIHEADLGERLAVLGQSVTRIADDLEVVSASADSLLDASRHMVVGMEPGLLRTLSSLDASMAGLARTTGRADTLVAATSQDVQATLKALRLLVERLEVVLTRIDTLVQRKEGQVDETVANLHATSAAVRRLSENPWRLVGGRGDGGVGEEMEAVDGRPGGRR